MIAVDTNLLVYAHREDSPFHERAYAGIEKLAGGLAAWAIPWPCLHEFYAIVTHPRIYSPSTPLVRELWSADRDFSRFPQLCVANPLVGK